MTRGPKPKPMALHQIHGTYRPARHGVEPGKHPVDEFDGFPVMPKTLSAAAKKVWKELVPQLVRRKVAVEIDTTALVAMCRFLAMYQSLMSRAEKMKPFDEPSELEQSRLERRARQAWDAFDKIASRFGMTPADRSRIRIDGNQASNKPASPLEALGISRN